MRFRAPSMPVLQLMRAALRPYEDRAQVAFEIFSHGDLVRVPLPGKRVYFTRSPDDFKRVLSDRASCYRKSFDYRILADLVGDGLIASEGEVWQRDRRLVQPLFHREMLAHFVSTISAVAQTTLDRWTSPTVCVSDEMTRIGITVIGHRVFSEDLSAHAARIGTLISSAQRHLIDRGAAPIDVAKYLPTPGRLKFLRGRRELDQLLEPLIARRLAEGSDRFDLLSILRDGGVTHREASDHVRTFFAAGYETTAVALTWLCHLLAENPAWQERLHVELTAAGLGSRAPTFEDLRRLPALRAVLEEALRLYPAVPLVGREALEDDVLGGFPIPKGSTVVLCFLAAHRDARNFPDPLRFDPSRFLPGRREAQRPYAHLPFAAGPRSCIGAQFAMMEMSLVLIELLKRFELAPVPGPELKAVPLVSLRPSRPVHVRLRRRARRVVSEAGVGMHSADQRCVSDP